MPVDPEIKRASDEAKRRNRARKTDKDLKQPHGVKVEDDQVTVTMPATGNPELGDYDAMLRERGLDPDEWTVVSVKANEWDAMTSDRATGDNRIVRMRQWTITLRPAAHRVLIMPAVHVPPVKRTRMGPPPSQQPVTILVESDHHVPFHDPDLDAASLLMIRELYRKYRLAEQIYLGDTGNWARLSRHPKRPSTTRFETPKQNIQGMYDLLRRKREAAPNCRARKVKGNHDERLETYQLQNASETFNVTAAKRWEEEVEPLPVMHLENLIHLSELGIELVEDERGWEHGEIEIVPGVAGLVARHGWLTGKNVALNSVKQRGRSVIVGHTHRPEHVQWWDPSSGIRRQGVVAPTMARVRDGAHPDYTTLDNWLQGCVVVTRWPDNEFTIEYAHWNGTEMRWRDKAWRAA